MDQAEWAQNKAKEWLNRKPMLDECRKCEGCGKVANTDDQEPWSSWESLPPGSDLAVRMGIVVPEDCPECGGSGKNAQHTEVIPLTDSHDDSMDQT